MPASRASWCRACAKGECQAERPTPEPPSLLWSGSLKPSSTPARGRCTGSTWTSRSPQICGTSLRDGQASRWMQPRLHHAPRRLPPRRGLCLYTSLLRVASSCPKESPIVNASVKDRSVQVVYNCSKGLTHKPAGTSCRLERQPPFQIRWTPRWGWLRWTTMRHRRFPTGRRPKKPSTSSWRKDTVGESMWLERHRSRRMARRIWGDIKRSRVGRRGGARSPERGVGNLGIPPRDGCSKLGFGRKVMRPAPEGKGAGAPPKKPGEQNGRETAEAKSRKIKGPASPPPKRHEARRRCAIQLLGARPNGTGHLWRPRGGH